MDCTAFGKVVAGPLNCDMILAPFPPFANEVIPRLLEDEDHDHTIFGNSGSGVPPVE
jgi:hypothetical protein